jgi:hypothetical protein
MFSVPVVLRIAATAAGQGLIAYEYPGCGYLTSVLAEPDDRTSGPLWS